MPSTKVIKPKPVDATKKTLEKSKPLKPRAGNHAEGGLQVSAAGRGRASNCPRSPRSPEQQQRGRSDRPPSGEPAAASRPGCGRRARSTAPTLTETAPRTEPVRRRASSSVRAAAVRGTCTDTSAGARTQRGGRAEAKYAVPSCKAFTVIPPNPRKRREIQRKAEAELAALEELRLSRAMAYVSINPSSVGGCMSLEEVRLKQQQEMMQAKRKHKQVKKVLEETTVLMS